MQHSKMLSGLVWTAVLGLVLVCSMADPNEAATPFKLTFSPSHVVKLFTERVTVRCAHEDDTVMSQLQDISRIHLLKKSPSGWKVVAEVRDNEPAPKTHTYNVSVSAKISSNIRDNFIEIVWPVASDDTFGNYRCDVIGFNRNSFLPTAEVTDELSLFEENVTTSDMLEMFLDTKDEMHHIEDDAAHVEGDVGVLNTQLSNLAEKVQLQGEDVSQLEEDMKTIRQNLNGVSGEVGVLKGDITSLKLEMDSVDENRKKIDTLNSKLENVRQDVNSLQGNPIASDSNTTQFGVLMSWPAGAYALLQPKTGCPVDLTFFGGSNRYWQIHTESSSGTTSKNAHSDVLSPYSLSTVNGKKFFTLRFCEANGILNTRSWPSGSYCINQINGSPCPTAFKEGDILLDSENNGRIKEYTSRSVQGSSLFQYLAFCCINSGNSSAAISLPTRSPFLLYRRGGQCQQVSGMSVSEESITIDTENDSNDDDTYNSVPDVDINGSIVKMYLCYYTPL